MDGLNVYPVSPTDLKGSLKSELAELQNRLNAQQPRTRAEQAVHKSLKEHLAQLTGPDPKPDAKCYFLKYRDEKGKWRLLWIWGCERTEATADAAAICIKPDCRTLFANNALAKGQCPQCKTPLPIPPNPLKRLAIVSVLFLLLAGAGFWGWWSMQPRAAIKGVILWAGNNQPVANAEVRLPEWELSTQTDKSGQFQFDRLPEGSAKLEILAAGFQPKSQTESLKVGEETALKIHLEGNAAIAGKIIDGVSKIPLKRAKIQIEGTEIQSQADDDGKFHIEGLPQGGQTLHVLMAGFPAKDQQVELTAENTTDVTVPLTGQGMLSGVVLQANNEQPLSGTKVELMGTGHSAVSNGEGVFVIRQVPTGKGELKFSAPGFAGKRLELIVEVNEHSQRILLLGAGILAGTVSSKSDGKPIPGATVRIEGAGVSAFTNKDGQFSLPSTPVGPVTVIVSAPGYRTVKYDKFIETGGPTLLEAQLEGGAALAGTVIDGTTGKPFPNAEIEVSTYPKPLRTDEAGMFKVEGAKAGPTTITVKATGMKPEKVTITLEPSKESKQEIKLMGDAELQGTLTDGLTGKPISQADLKIADTILTGKTDAEGSFKIGGLRSGQTKPANIEVSAKGYSPASFSQKLNPGNGNSVAWNLTGNSVLTGTVMDLAKDAPVADAEATIKGTKVKVKTDKNGVFRLEKLPALPVMLDITAPGYNPQTVEQDILPNKPANMKILLGGDAVIVGEVYDTLTNKPVPNVKIGIEGSTLASRTDQKGQFRLANAIPGKANVQASSPDYPPQSEKVDLESKKVTKIRFGLTGDAVAKGTVLSLAGDPILGAIVKLPGTNHQAQTVKGGMFELKELPGGPVTLEVSAENYKTQSLKGELVTGKPTQLPAAKLVSGLNVTGEVISALNAKGLPNATVKIPGTQITATSDAKGLFRLEGVPIRDFTIEAEAKDFYTETQQVVNPQGNPTIKLVLAPILNPGEIRIVLLWGQKIKNLDLHLHGPNNLRVGQNNRKAGPAQLDVDNRNGFGPETITMKSPPPGRYQIYVHAFKEKINESEAEVRIYQAGKKTGQIIKVSSGEAAAKPVWNTGAIEVDQAGKATIHPYESFNYDDQLPK